MTPQLLTGGLRNSDPRRFVADMAGIPANAPFSPESVDFCAELSRSLFRAGMKDRPEVSALAFWCRPAEVARLRAAFDSLASPQVSLVPRGTVFHVPPVNVETLFLYGWLLSILCGNRNIVRISSRASGFTMELCDLVASLLGNYGSLARINAAVTYGHDDRLTADLSANCDLRVVWGGDETVLALRSVALPPTARDLCFPDRYSFSVIRAAAYSACPDARKRTLAHAFYNDCYWFDQMACSSPRLTVWCGSPRDCASARAEFFGFLAEEIGRQTYQAEAATRNGKLLFSSRLILDESVDSFEEYGRELTVLRLRDLSLLDRDHCGGGLLLSADIADLADLAPMVGRRDQTLTYFGFEPHEMALFARALNGKGIDRIVPVGEALTFNRFWDGCDLLQEFTRRVWVQ